MKLRRFVKRSIDNQKKLFLILLLTAVGTGVLAFVIQYFWGESSVYKETLYVELNPESKPNVNIYTAGMMVEIAVWDGDEVKIECVAEMPLIVETDKFVDEIKISQDDGFAVSLFTLDMFRYKMKIFFPQDALYKDISIKTAGGNVDIDSHGLIAERVLVETKNASVNVKRAVCTYVITTQSGDVYMDYDYLISAAVVESESGDVQIKIPDYETVYADSMLRVNTKTGVYEIIEKDSNLPENYPLA